MSNKQDARRKVAPRARRGEGLSDERRSALLEAVIEAIGETGPDASMDRIATRVGVAKPILYRHFGSKEGLVRALTRHYLGQIWELASGVDPSDLRQTVAAQLDAVARYFEKRPGLLEFINREGGFLLAAQDTESEPDQVGQLIAGLAAARGVDPALVPVWTHGIGGMMNASFLHWLEDRRLRGRRALSRQRFVEALTAQLFEGAVGTFVPERGA